jgi:hypothetical protein
MKNNNMYDIASGMDAILKDPEYKSMFSSSAVLEKLAFKRVADEELPTEIEVELSAELMDSLEATAAEENPRETCLLCMGKRAAGSTGVCKCSTGSCKGLKTCGAGCSCGCKAKSAGVSMSDTLIKSAFDSLMSASSDLEEAGFEMLSANALVLMNNLIVEAKEKKMSKEDKAKAKAKADEAKAKAKAKAEAEKEKAAKMKAKEKAKVDQNKADDAKAKATAKAKSDKAKEQAAAAKAKAEKAKAKK